MSSLRLLPLVCVVAVSLLGVWISRADDPKPAAPTMVPVEPSMHEFMEYVFEPSYKQLKASLASEPADRKDWSPIKGGALTLAESSNLLLLRAPKDDADTWNSQTLAVREAGGALYSAAKARDYAATKTAWAALLTKCNACHDTFAGGEHQLVP